MRKLAAYQLHSFYPYCSTCDCSQLESYLFVLQICRRCSVSSRNKLKFTLLCVRLCLFEIQICARRRVNYLTCRVCAPCLTRIRYHALISVCNKKSCRMANTRESERGNLIKLIREVPAQELIFYTQGS
jgi:hypothetical protein